MNLFNKNATHLIMGEHKKFKDYNWNLRKRFKNSIATQNPRNNQQDNKVNGWLKNHILKIKLLSLKVNQMKINDCMMHCSQLYNVRKNNILASSNPSNDYQESTLELLETNRNLSAAMDKMEMRCKQLEEKVTKLKKFKKIVKNSCSITCLHCNRQY